MFHLPVVYMQKEGWAFTGACQSWAACRDGVWLMRSFECFWGLLCPRYTAISVRKVIIVVSYKLLITKKVPDNYKRGLQK